MAKRKSPKLAVVLSRSAQISLQEIWNYNSMRRSVREADAYDAFLRNNIDGLAKNYPNGKEVEGVPDVRALTVKKRRSGDGHVVIFDIDGAGGVVNVLQIFHTKMDIPGRLAD